MRRGVIDWNGEGEAVGGVVVVRSGENVRRSSRRSRRRSREFPRPSPGREAIAYDRDRSSSIRAIDTLRRTLIEEMIVVALVIVVFLFHFRSALVPITVLPIAIAISFLPMYLLGVSSNIMSLGGLALAIGCSSMPRSSWSRTRTATCRACDPAAGRAAGGRSSPPRSRSAGRSSSRSSSSSSPSCRCSCSTGEGGPPLPSARIHEDVRDRRRVYPVCHAGPILMIVWMRGRIRPEEENPIAVFFRRLYAPVIRARCDWKGRRWLINFPVVPLTIPLALLGIGSEFMPPLLEGALLYMPTRRPDVRHRRPRGSCRSGPRSFGPFPEVESVSRDAPATAPPQRPRADGDV